MGLGESFSPLGKLLSKRKGYMTQDEIIEMARQAGFDVKEWGDETLIRTVHSKGYFVVINKKIEAFAKLVEEEERTFCIQFLMELHSAQMGAHNYYHYAAQALSQLEGKELPAKFSLTIEKEKPIKKYND